jgi:hypothetical protein
MRPATAIAIVLLQSALVYSVFVPKSPNTRHQDASSRPLNSTASSDCPCPSTFTCCYMTIYGDWGCCPVSGGTCCNEGTYCCPPQYPVCYGTSSCSKTLSYRGDDHDDDPQQQKLDQTQFSTLVAAEVRPTQARILFRSLAQHANLKVVNGTGTRDKDGVAVLGDTECPDDSTCGDDESCCAISATRYGCCPYKGFTVLHCFCLCLFFFFFFVESRSHSITCLLPSPC